MAKFRLCVRADDLVPFAWFRVLLDLFLGSLSDDGRDEHAIV